MGIGGLDAEFSAIFRRAFASRIFPPSLVEKLGIQHVKGWKYITIIEMYMVDSFIRLLIQFGSYLKVFFFMDHRERAKL